MISKNYNCRECGKEFKTAYALAEHLRSAHQIQMQEYYDKYFNDGTEGKCECCGKPTKFISLRDGYRKKCEKCAYKHINRDSEISIKCEECGYTITGYHTLFSKHLKNNHHMTVQEYYDKHLKKPDEGKCQHCGAPTNFNNINEGYRKYCQKCKNVVGYLAGQKQIAIEKEHQKQLEETKRTREEMLQNYMAGLQNELKKYEWEGEKSTWMGGPMSKPTNERNNLLTDNSVSYIDGQSYDAMGQCITEHYKDQNNVEVDEDDHIEYEDQFWL